MLTSLRIRPLSSVAEQLPEEVKALYFQHFPEVQAYQQVLFFQAKGKKAFSELYAEVKQWKPEKGIEALQDKRNSLDALVQRYMQLQEKISQHQKMYSDFPALPNIPVLQQYHQLHIAIAKLNEEACCLAPTLQTSCFDRESLEMMVALPERVELAVKEQAPRTRWRKRIVPAFTYPDKQQEYSGIAQMAQHYIDCWEDLQATKQRYAKQHEELKRLQKVTRALLKTPELPLEFSLSAVTLESEQYTELRTVQEQYQALQQAKKRYEATVKKLAERLWKEIEQCSSYEPMEDLQERVKQAAARVEDISIKAAQLEKLAPIIPLDMEAVLPIKARAVQELRFAEEALKPKTVIVWENRTERRPLWESNVLQF
ncbi:hypothetical protein HYS48_03765 [Candidatus Woesearchaeota archaeon]|nr:hypothetical protein [Candidatus Woesearchaeota archaeon]